MRKTYWGVGLLTLVSVCNYTSLADEKTSPNLAIKPIHSIPHPCTLRYTTPAMREAAAARKGIMVNKSSTPQPGGQPNYFGPEPNYANSPLAVVKTHHDRTIKSITGIRKFVDSLPGLGSSNKNNLGQYIPVASPDTTAYPGSDYYVLGVVEYTQKLHSDLSSTKLRGYVQLNGKHAPTNPPKAAHYLGPFIIAQRNRPVRLLFSNLLSTGGGGNLFLPVDTTVMGAGTGPNMGTELYTQNRSGIHLHGGVTPWISDGTPHQWITPAGEITSYPQGVSLHNVPDMPTPPSGQATYYYTNQQSSRLMWYHDHSYGITRLNVYAGEVSGYLLTDSVEEDLINSKVLPSGDDAYRYGIPLIIQDKTFVPSHSQLVKQDPTWNWRSSVGSLWFPHVYMPNQNPNDLCGCNNLGRWDYGPWFWPPVTAATGLVHGPIFDIQTGLLIPGTPNPSIVPEAFLDTPVINGVAYPYLEVSRKAYRFRVLNGCNDRSLNLQLYYADPLAVSIIDGGSGYSSKPKVTFTGGLDKKKKGARNATGKAIISNGKVTGVTITDPGSGYISAPLIVFSGGGKHIKKAIAIASINSEVRMIPASPTAIVPPYYPMMDGRAGGVPDPSMAGPSMIQIGTEGGFLPNPVVLPNTPIGYQYNRRDITVLNVLEKTLFLGPAERADVIIDFSTVPGHVSTVILYNDAPAPVPAFDPRYDYYTGDPDQTSTGGAPSTIAGYGPNTRTILQFRVSGQAHHPYDLSKLQQKLPSSYTSSQPAPVIPETAYPAPFQSSTDTYSRIQDTSLTFTPLGSINSITVPMQPKAIQELFELNYGRMNATLGTELPLTSFANQTTVPLGYIDPPTEFLAEGDIQIWKITHNGVDTHAIHTHLFNMQLINRVGWDGAIRPPDPNELGWKDTIRMNPLEDTIVAIRPVAPQVPFLIPNSIRLLNPTMMEGMTWQSIDPITGNPVTVTNVETNFGAEYVWHCHLLGHEENDMMRPIVFNLLPGVPRNVAALPGPLLGGVTITFSPPISTGTGGGTIVYTAISSPGGFSSSSLSSPITVSGLTRGTSYTFTVSAKNSAGTGLPSLTSNSVIAP